MMSSPMPAPNRLSLADIPRKLDQLAEASSTKNAFSKETVEHLVEQVSTYASINGFSHAHLEQLLRVLTANKTFLDAAKVRVLVKSLIPRGKIRHSAVIHLVNSLGEGQNKAVYATQALLFRWLIMVYEFLESYGILERLYSVLFNFLHTANLRPHACHLLALCTRRKDVRPHRIQALMKMYDDHSDEVAVIGLLQVYQSFYPDIILSGSRKSSRFKIWDPVWVQTVSLLQASGEQNANDLSVNNEAARRRSNRLLSRNKSDIVPSLHTFDASENSITLEEIRDNRKLVDSLYKLDLPSQLGAVYEDDALRYLVNLRSSDESIHQRLDSWTSGALFDELEIERASSSTSQRLDKFLGQILDYTGLRKTLLPSVVDFLREYIKDWNGIRHKQVFLGLLSYAQFAPLKELREDYFDHLEKLYLTGPAADTATLVRFHASFMQNVIIHYSSSSSTENEKEIRETIGLYIKHVNDLCVRITLNSKDSPLLIPNLYAFIDFYDVVTTIPLENPLFEIVYPPDSIVYSSVFVGDAMSFSRMCGILAKYKSLFIKNNQLRETDTRVATYPEPDRGYVDHFNGFLMDISNFFWRFRSFSREDVKDQNALGCLLTDELIMLLNDISNSRELALNGLFTVTHSAVFSRFNADCIRFFEDQQEDTIQVRHAGPVTSKSLSGLAGDGGIKIDYRLFKMASLEFLRRRGFVGIHDLIYSTMKKLREEREKHGVEGMFAGFTSIY